ncbi:hypothetical protein [Micromonospora marina]|uniref:hypothetical protein n=1 Tax=Micromonospora marina TaxID=307120 RepID=UPI003454E743
MAALSHVVQPYRSGRATDAALAVDTEAFTHFATAMDGVGKALEFVEKQLKSVKLAPGAFPAAQAIAEKTDADNPKGLAKQYAEKLYDMRGGLREVSDAVRELAQTYKRIEDVNVEDAGRLVQTVERAVPKTVGSG